LAELSIVEAINDAFHVELERDASVMVLGEDVGRAGGVFRATAGLRDKFGRTAASTHPSPKRESSAAPSACAWPVGSLFARCSTTRSRIPVSTS
jgi:pyruvate/2-oxoglutarate/acetoin dehydrogenase E1 component